MNFRRTLSSRGIVARGVLGFSAVVLFASLAACSSSDEASAFGGADAPSNGGRADTGGEGSSTGSAGASESGEPGASDGSGTPGSESQSGTLTAGVWDDNLNFDFYKKYLGASDGLSGLPFFSDAEREAARGRAAQRAGSSELDIAFLFDTTGSMGDELSYLNVEIDAIAGSIKEKFPSINPRFALVAYKDHGDTFVSQSHAFGDLAAFKSALRAQSASGGGDYPEAVPEGLQASMQLSWRGGAVARLLFWIADAPHHVGDEQSVRGSIDSAVQRGIHLYPVAASGTDPRAEHTMRTAAQMTGGRYVFLTDDSGVGGAHAEPHIPCYQVTRFDRAIVRMVESEVTGTHIHPSPSEVLRKVGSPVDGKCETKSSGQVSIY